ncbi:MAG: phage tail protein [Oscillospiraceae bacterium]
MEEEYLGTIKLFAFSYIPPNYLLCDGRTLNIHDYMALYSVLGNYFGGDNQQTFCLPDLRGKEPVPYTEYCICVNGLYPSRS